MKKLLIGLIILATVICVIGQIAFEAQKKQAQTLSVMEAQANAIEAQADAIKVQAEANAEAMHSQAQALRSQSFLLDVTTVIEFGLFILVCLLIFLLMKKKPTIGGGL